MASLGAATILHADLDAFYASVEQLLDPTLRGRPIAVGGGDRGGVVLAASYEARAFGVTAAMPGGRARQLCPGLRFVSGHFGEYQRLGDEVMSLFGDFTPWVERISIDEAFLDVAGAVGLFGSPADMARAIRRRVRDEIGLALSVGVARTKHLAKIASQVAKPDGLIVVEAGDERAFLDPLPVDLMWGVGPVTRERLAAAGLRTIGDLAAVSSPLLEHLLGHAVGVKLAALTVDDDPRSISSSRPSVSVGAQSAMGRRDATPRLVRSTLAYLADRVAGRLRAAGQAGRTVTVRVRFTGLHAVTRSTTLPVAIAGTLSLTELATELAGSALVDHPGRRQITLLAVSVSNLVQESSLQLELPLGLPIDPRRPGTPSGLARLGMDRSVDAIRARFGRDAIGYADVALSDQDGVPEAFRELAQRRPAPP
jgi:DNA polymerase-4